MNAYLVGAAGCWDRFYNSGVFPGLKETQPGHGWFPCMSVDDGAVAVPNIDPQRQVYRLLFPGRSAMDQCMVNLLDEALLELAVELTMRFRTAPQDDHPAGLAVQAVDDPYTPYLGF
jgi:hypothetical protein